MSAVVSTLPTRRAIDDAWDEYARLVCASENDPALRVSQEHQIAVVRAHKRWSDLFLASDRPR